MFSLCLVSAGTVTMSVGGVTFLQASWNVRQHTSLPFSRGRAFSFLLFSSPGMMGLPQGPQDASELPLPREDESFCFLEMTRDETELSLGAIPLPELQGSPGPQATVLCPSSCRGRCQVGGRDMRGSGRSGRGCCSSPRPTPQHRLLCPPRFPMGTWCRKNPQDLQTALCW